MSDLARGFSREPQSMTEATSPDSGFRVIVADDGGEPIIDPETGAMSIELEDGQVLIDLDPPSQEEDDSEDFYENLAEKISENDLQHIANDLLEAITADELSRVDWLDTRAKGIEMLGFKVDEERSATATGSPTDGMSSVRHPLLAEAVIRFQANASAELYPTEGPVKVRNDQMPVPPNSDIPDPSGLNKNDLAEALERGFNHYLTNIDKGYRSDSVRMLFWVGFGGCGFKKVYNDPIRRMPLSRSVDAQDLIVNNSANDINDAGRVTHVIKMRRSTLVRMQIAGAYRKVSDLTDPTENINVVDDKIAEVKGFAARNNRPEDNEYTVYECYCELDIPGYEHKVEGQISGLQLPYRVSIEKDSRQVLDVRRNWKPDDEMCRQKQVFVKFPFVMTMGFYDTGLLQILGNTDKALTGAWRLMLDAGMFSNFPGFLYSENSGRQTTNNFQVPPGGGAKVQTGGQPIQNVVMPLPYKDVSAGLMQLAKGIEEAGQRLGGTAELQVAETKQDAPVGTTLAMIEQATKVLAAVHVNLHAAQAEEFQLLKECFREDPEAFWRHDRRPVKQWEVAEFIQALNDYDLVPMADPNTPSHMHRIMKAVAIKQLQAANPQMYDAKAVDTRIYRMIGVPNPQALFSQQEAPPAPPPDPKLIELQMEAQMKAQEMKVRAADAQTEAQAKVRDDQVRLHADQTESADRAADRASRERVALEKEHTARMKIQAEAQAKSNDNMVKAQAAQPGHFADGGEVDPNDAPPDKVAAPQPQELPEWAQNYHAFASGPRTESPDLGEDGEKKFQQDMANSKYFKTLHKKLKQDPANADLTQEELLNEVTDPNGDYNIRMAHQLGINPTLNKYDGLYHYPDSAPDGTMLKQPDHPTAWMNFFQNQYGIDPQNLGINSYLSALQYSQQHNAPARKK